MPTILFPTDFSETANNAFIYALNLAKAKTADIRIVTLKTHLRSYLDMQESEFDEQISQLKSIAKNQGFEDIKLKSSLEIGDLLITILDIVKKENISYIVMGTNGENSFGKKFFGSQTLSIIKNSPVPVLAIPDGVKYKDHLNFAYATVFNEKENEAIDKMVSFSDEYEAELTMVHVLNNPLSEEAKKLQSSWKEKYKKLKSAFIENDEVENGLLTYCKSSQVDILGIVYRDLNPFQRLFTESYSRQLLSSAKFAILVLKEKM